MKNNKAFSGKTGADSGRGKEGGFIRRRRDGLFDSGESTGKKSRSARGRILTLF